MLSKSYGGTYCLGSDYFPCSAQWPPLSVCQVCWRWCQLCCSWGTWHSRRSATVIRPPCLMTPVHTFTQTHDHCQFLCACCLSHSSYWNFPNSFNIHLYILQHVSTPAAQKVCHLLSINVTEFSRAILSPRIKVCITMNTWTFCEVLKCEMFTEWLQPLSSWFCLDIEEHFWNIFFTFVWTWCYFL